MCYDPLDHVGSAVVNLADQGANNHGGSPFTVTTGPPNNTKHARGPNTAQRASSTHTHTVSVTLSNEDLRALDVGDGVYAVFRFYSDTCFSRRARV